MPYEIRNENDHQEALDRIDHLMKKGEANVSKEESQTIRELGLAIQAYENRLYTIPTPATLEGMIELRMYERKLRQKDLARELGISDAKLSLILSGKKKPDVSFLKAVYLKLDVSADFILQHV